MANSRKTYTGDGSTQVYTVTFPYIDRSHVKAFVDGVEAPFSFINDSSISFDAAPADGAVVLIQRVTSQEAIVDFQNGSTLIEDDLDNIVLHSLYLVEEAADSVAATLQLNSEDNWEGDGKNVSNVSDPVNSQDAATMAWVNSTFSTVLSQLNSARDAAIAARDAAQTSAGNAQTSETNAQQYEDKAQEWASEDEDVEVETGLYSAKHYAQKAADAAETLTKADTAEAEAGTNDTKYMTPLKVKQSFNDLVTVSDADPSGGEDGDIWIKY